MNDPTEPVADPFARKLKSQYLGRRRMDVTRLRCDLAERRFEAIQRAGHNMFGSGAAYGFESISRLGARLESAAERCETATTGDLIDELEKILASLDVA